MPQRYVEIVGARTHNLRNISTRIPLGRLTVVTGVSGSGKSTLAFDTLYAEGQRRFVESMSTYARQFIEKMARPDVDRILNIQPAIAIEQKNSVKNARSTIGTATEINDHLRLLFAKAGTTICPGCALEVREDSPQSVAAELLARHAGARAYLVAPVALGPKASPAAIRDELLRGGFTRVMAGDGAASSPALLDLQEATDDDVARALGGGAMRVLVDRVVVSPDDYERLTSSLAIAFQAGRDTLEVHLADAPAGTPPLVFHSGFRCNGCARAFPRPEPNLFSFNLPLGACPECSGFGRVTGIDWDKVLPDRSLPMARKPVAPWNSPAYRSCYGWMKKESTRGEIPWDVPLDQFTPAQWNNLLHGTGKFGGISEFFSWLEKERYKVQSRIMVARYRGFTTCPQCDGSRLVPAARNVLWAPRDGSMPRRHIAEVTRMSIHDLLAEWVATRLDAHEEQLFGRVFREILSRLTYLVRVGLGYLTLDRQTRTLSGGEAQRINLATALGTALTQTLYVLDEPTVGLHPRDSRRLLEILQDLRDKGNTIVVVEHDPELILGADHLIDMGPRAGTHGGRIVFEGPPSALFDDGTETLTADCLRGRHGGGDALPRAAEDPPRAKPRRAPARRAPAGDAVIRITGACEHNLKDLSVDIPLHRWVCVTGVSGSGKTTLVHSILYQGFNQHRKLAVEDLGRFRSIAGLDALDEMLLVDQSPIGRSLRSNPVTYVKAYDPIRKLMAATREARTLGLGEGSFSFNVKGGRCEACEGTGMTTYDMHFLAEMTLPCEMCGGKRFQPRVLEVPYKGRNIDDILAMTVDDACGFFGDQSTVVRRLAPLREVGLGYLTLGQSTSTLSGGEAQRLKLASHLATGSDLSRTMMIFDEPTTGLHLADLAVLAGVFRSLVARGCSLVVIEHNLEIIREADWIIDLGPEGGDGGGCLVAEGPPERVARTRDSHTGRFLAELLRQ